METKVCGICGETKPIRTFARSFGVSRKNTCNGCKSRIYSAKLKYELLEAFGFACQCCGERHPDFLTLDHLVGTNHYGTGSTTQQLYAEAKRDNWDKSKYQLLCLNCNAAKGWFGSCPHQTGETPEVRLARLRLDGIGIGRGFVKHTQTFKPGYDPRRSSVVGPNLERLADKLAAAGVTVEQLAQMFTK